jgi:hypothetical protein
LTIAEFATVTSNPEPTVTGHAGPTVTDHAGPTIIGHPELAVTGHVEPIFFSIVLLSHHLVYREALSCSLTNFGYSATKVLRHQYLYYQMTPIQSSSTSPGSKRFVDFLNLLMLHRESHSKSKHHHCCRMAKDSSYMYYLLEGRDGLILRATFNLPKK